MAIRHDGSRPSSGIFGLNGTSRASDVTVVNTAKKRARTKSRWLDASTISSSGSFRAFIDYLRLLMKSVTTDNGSAATDTGHRRLAFRTSLRNETLDDVVGLVCFFQQ